MIEIVSSLYLTSGLPEKRDYGLFYKLYSGIYASSQNKVQKYSNDDNNVRAYNVLSFLVLCYCVYLKIVAEKPSLLILGAFGSANELEFWFCYHGSPKTNLKQCTIMKAVPIWEIK